MSCSFEQQQDRSPKLSDPVEAGGRSRSSTAYAVVIIAVALLAITRHLLHWRYGSPDLNWVSIAALALTPLAVRYQVTISRSRPDLRLGLLPALLFSADPSLTSTILPIWAILILLGCWLTRDKQINPLIRTAMHVISGGALLAVSRHIDFGYGPYDRTFLALLTYFIVLALLESLRRMSVEPAGDRWLKLRWTWCLLTTLGIFYVAAFISVLRQLQDGLTVPVHVTVVVALLGASALSVGLVLRHQELVRSLKSLDAAAAAMPWARNQIGTNLRRWMGSGLRARSVTITPSSEPAAAGGLAATLADGRGLCVARDRGDLPFSAIDKSTFHTLVAMASVSLQRADQDDHLLHQVATDPLTGLDTYSHFRDQLEVLNVERDVGEILGLIVLDLDQFKAINEAFTHVVGDQVIRELGTRLRVFCESGLVSRYAGDEFVIAVRHVEDYAALRFEAEKVLSLIGAPIQVGAVIVHMQASVGLALSTPSDDSIDDWMREADRQMYRRKQNLRANVNESEIRLDNAVRSGIVGQRIEAVFQPIVDLTSGEVVMLEALARLADPRLGPIAPEVLVSIAMRLNLLDELTKQVAVQTFEMVRAVAQVGVRLDGVTINVEPSQLEIWSPMLDELVALVQSNETSLILEISERSVISWDAQRRRVADRLAAAGIGLAIDDFGVGYSSLGALHSTAATWIKIDKSMVDDIVAPRQQSVITAMLSVLAELAFDVILEGIETEDTSIQLQAIGARWGQGKLFGMPLSREQLLERLRSHGRISVVD